MKQLEIVKQYERLLNDVKTKEYYTRIDITKSINCYVCDTCGHITKTKDIDPGVTPYLFKCEKCGELARSTFYRDIAPNQKPTIEWYRPTLKETLKMGIGMVDHILQGGLDSRVIKQEGQT